MPYTEIGKKILEKAVKCLRRIDGIQYDEQVTDDSIGIIIDHTRNIRVSFREDNFGQYLELSYITSYVGSVELVQEYLSRWIVNGRYEINADHIRLFSIITILDERYLIKQIKHALLEIWDMERIAQSPFK